MSPFSGSATTRLHAAPGTWTLTAPTTAGFSVGSLGVRKVAGTIPVITAQVDVAEDGSVHSVAAVLSIDRIDTGHTKRDKDLRRRGLLDLDTHPTLTFSSAQVTPGEAGWTVTGLLTAKGATRQITVQATTSEHDDGTVGVRLTGRLDRRDYGIKAPRFLISASVLFDIDARLRRT
ncbi:MAG: YceI family protein [Geodermatophilaceae bacterium]|nr:YceI family protein [Geodermatophilaceae bacterium]